MLEILFLEFKICVALLPLTLFRLPKEIFYEKKVGWVMMTSLTDSASCWRLWRKAR